MEMRESQAIEVKPGEIFHGILEDCYRGGDRHLIVSAGDLDEAKEKIRRHPGFSGGDLTIFSEEELKGKRLVIYDYIGVNGTKTERHVIIVAASADEARKILGARIKNFEIKKIGQKNY